MFSVRHFINRFRKAQAGCGHETRLAGIVKGQGQEVKMVLGRNKAGEIPYCFGCLGEKVIRCAWCGDPIFPGDPITLYAPKDVANFTLREGAVLYDQEKTQVVGCLRWDCADTGADVAGHWTPDGVVRCPRIIDILMANPDADAIIVNDMTKFHEQGSYEAVKLRGTD